MEAILTSTAVVAIAEIGDKTQLLAIVLAARLRNPVPIILGILAATLLNHAVAAAVGYLVAQWVTGRTFQVVLGAAFIAMAAWALVPDKEQEGAGQRSAGGIFLTTLVAFFLVEIGDNRNACLAGPAGGQGRRGGIVAVDVERAGIHDPLAGNLFGLQHQPVVAAIEHRPLACGIDQNQRLRAHAAGNCDDAARGWRPAFGSGED